MVNVERFPRQHFAANDFDGCELCSCAAVACCSGALKKGKFLYAEVVALSEAGGEGAGTGLEGKASWTTAYICIAALMLLRPA